MLRIEVAISTIGEGIERARDVLLPQQDGLTYLIIHQTPDDGGTSRAAEVFAERPDIRYFQFDERGLSRSRNRALNLAQGDILIPTDDDVRLLPQALESISAEFELRPNLAILTAQLTDAAGEKLRKRYSAAAFRHTVRSCLRTTSPEFAVRPELLRRTGLRWNEAFGLGALYPVGEENLLLMDAVRMGLECRYLPVPLAGTEAGTGYRMNVQSGFARGALFTEMFGILSPLMILNFALRKRKMIEGGVAGFLGHAWRGMVARMRDRPRNGLLGRAGLWTIPRRGWGREATDGA